MEEQRHEELMKFMNTFKLSIEERFKDTNEKLDDKLNDMKEQMNDMNNKIEQNDGDTKKILKRMNERMKQLEDEMKKTAERKDDRGEVHRELEKKEEVSRRLEDQKGRTKVIEQGKYRGDKKEEVKKKKKQFERRTIRQEDLEKQVEEVIVTEEENSPIEQTSFRSNWALEVEKEIQEQADLQGRSYRDGNTNRVSEWKELQSRTNDDIWEGIIRKKNVEKVRKPAIIKNWFADESDTNVTISSSEESIEDEEKWERVDRKKRNIIRRDERKWKKNDKMKEVSTKMKHMVGLGPVRSESIDFFEKQTNDRNEALIKAVQEYLEYKLNFDREEIEKIEIIEVKQAKDDVLYIAVKNQEHIKDIYYRRAITEDQELKIRDYIPPSFYARYMALARKAAERRAADGKLKTQIRWGDSDIEMFVKEKGTNEQLKKTNLLEFMGETDLPEFDTSVKWRKRDLNRNRIEERRKSNRDGLPSLRNREKSAPMRRQLSDKSREGGNKKLRITSTDTEESNYGDSDDAMQTDPLDVESPASRKISTENYKKDQSC